MVFFEAGNSECCEFVQSDKTAQHVGGLSYVKLITFDGLAYVTKGKTWGQFDFLFLSRTLFKY